VFVALNPGALPARERSPAELYQRVCRDEYATLGANVVVELNSDSRARQPTSRAWRSSAGPTAATGWATNARAAPTVATPTEPTAPAGPTNSKSRRWWFITKAPLVVSRWTTVLGVLSGAKIAG
jgi:hypothetical protein